MQSNPSQDPHPPSNGPVTTTTAAESQNANTPSAKQSQPRKSTVRKSNQICRFYGTKKGCRAQDQCPYRHVQQTDQLRQHEQLLPDDDRSDTARERSASPREAGAVSGQQHAHGPVQRPAVAKPVSSLQQRDPREFQLNQIVRRFSPSREDTDNSTSLRFKLLPSDPDFPFELDALECVLTIPLTYPKDGAPSLRVENKEIPRGFQINIERGFDSLRSGSSNRTLLQLLNDLDRNLERFLTSEKAQTIKIVANRGKEKAPEARSVAVGKPSPDLPVNVALAPPQPAWTAQQKANAKAKREVEIRQLEARMGRIPLFSSSKDGITFNIPLQIPKPKQLPLAVQSLKTATLVVPQMYDLEPCRILLQGVASPEALNVEIAFEKRATEQRDLSLMAHINYLTQNIHLMATALATTPVAAEAVQPVSAALSEQGGQQTEAQQSSSAIEEGVVDQDRPHLRFMSHPPPEWNRATTEAEESDSETTDDYSEEDTSDASEDAQSQAGGAFVPTSAPSTSLEKGILLSFPQLELHGIELLELCDISLSVKCDRCKTTTDVKTIKAAEPGSISIRTESCNKCASPLSLSYRSEPMHVNSIKAGYLDLEGCSIVDMLPSHFSPTCSECSTTYPLPGITSVRGESPIAVCRECHHRLNFKIPEVKFLRVSSNDPRLALPLRSKRKKENLGITAGTELPERGRCKHYSKSYRWFRFSCCNRVYPCDRCHDEKEEHLNEHANRMICGWCSREQNYRPEDCHSCGRSVIRKTGGGFWEGGKGTRDKNKMSRKDPRKYKRIGGGAKGGEK